MGRDPGAATLTVEVSYQPLCVACYQFDPAFGNQRPGITVVSG
ncbi:MAG TPA: hypothetical protein VIY49_16585 [Bryobacteraceae bacterium]